MTTANVTWAAVGVRSSWGDADDLRWLRNSEFSAIWKITRLFSPRTVLVFHIFFLHRNTHLLQIFTAQNRFYQSEICLDYFMSRWDVYWAGAHDRGGEIFISFAWKIMQQCNCEFWLMSELEISWWFEVMGGCAHWMTELGRQCWLSHRSNFWDEFQNFYDVRQNAQTQNKLSHSDHNSLNNLVWYTLIAHNGRLLPHTVDVKLFNFRPFLTVNLMLLFDSNFPLTSSRRISTSCLYQTRNARLFTFALRSQLKMLTTSQK